MGACACVCVPVCLPIFSVFNCMNDYDLFFSPDNKVNLRMRGNIYLRHKCLMYPRTVNAHVHTRTHNTGGGHTRKAFIGHVGVAARNNVSDDIKMKLLFGPKSSYTS